MPDDHEALEMDTDDRDERLETGELVEPEDAPVSVILEADE